MNCAKVLVLACFAALSVACADPQAVSRRVRSMAPAEAAALTADSKVIVVDVSTTEDFATAHIPNAISIPRDELGLRVREIASNPTLNVLIYGAQDRRVHSAGVLVADETEDAVYTLTGGLQAWRRAGLPVARSDSVARTEH